MNRHAYILLLVLVLTPVLVRADGSTDNALVTNGLQQLVDSNQQKLNEAREGVKRAQDALDAVTREEDRPAKEEDLRQARLKEADAQRNLDAAKAARDQSASQQPKFQDGSEKGGQQAQGGGGEGGGKGMPMMPPQSPQQQQSKNDDNQQQPTPAPSAMPTIAAQATPDTKPTDDPYALTQQQIDKEKKALEDAKAAANEPPQLVSPDVKSVSQIMNEMMDQKLKEAQSAQGQQTPAPTEVAARKSGKDDAPPAASGGVSSGSNPSPKPETPYVTDSSAFGNGRGIYLGGGSSAPAGGGAGTGGAGDSFFASVGASGGALFDSLLGRGKRVAADGAGGPSGGGGDGGSASGGKDSGNSDLSNLLQMMNPGAANPAAAGGGGGGTTLEVPRPAPTPTPAPGERGLASDDPKASKKAPNYKMDIDAPTALKRSLARIQPTVLGSTPRNHLRIPGTKPNPRLSLLK